MVSVLNAGKSLRNTLNYNEQKLRQGKATLIHSAGFGKDTQQLSFSDKLGHLQKLASRNERTTVNSIHISLNFDPSEKLSEDTLRRIAESYIQKIGFEGQPFLVYQHHDAGHPHVHIVTTNIRPDGKRIKLHNIGRNQSEKARKAIEKEFQLVRADYHQRQALYELKPVNAQKVQYGRSETKRAITTVLDHVIPTYKYSSLPELNAVLRSYNVVADQGGNDSRIFKANGLVYRVLDEQGKRVGVPIKASDLYNKPTLKVLQQRFDQNETAKQAHKQRVKNAVDLSFARQPNLSLSGLTESLRKENIQLFLRQNADGVIYGITYIDHKNKAVFNGSTLGKPYGANQIVQRTAHISSTQDIHNSQKEAPRHQPLPSQAPPGPQGPHKPSSGPAVPIPPGTNETVPTTIDSQHGFIKEVVNELTDAQGGSGPAAELKQELRKRRKRKPRL